MVPFSMLDKLQLESVNKLHATIILTIIVCVKMVWNSEEKEIKLLKHGKTVIAVKPKPQIVWANLQFHLYSIFRPKNG